MEILKIILVGVVTSVATVILKQLKPELSILATLAGSLVILLLIIDQLTGVVSYFREIVNKTSIDFKLFGNVLKIVGVGYLTEFGANICQDTGNSSIADKVLLAGKVIILFLAFPIINSMLSTIVELL